MLLQLLSAFDPKFDMVKEAPRAFVFAIKAVEYAFKLTGFFILLCLIVGLTLSACPENAFLRAIPITLGMMFLLHIAITLIGIPIFRLAHLLPGTKMRRVLSWTSLVVMAGFIFWAIQDAPIFDLLVRYVERLFPEAGSCQMAIVNGD